MWLDDGSPDAAVGVVDQPVPPCMHEPAIFHLVSLIVLTVGKFGYYWLGNP